MSWITLHDEVRAIAHLLTADVTGPVNLVAPNPATNRELTQAINRAVHRPTFPVPVPGLALKAALGPFAAEGVLIGQRLVPGVLQQSGFAFEHSDLDDALVFVLRR
jgi:NAD dependent epimerase/dehydratase family enzyme